MQVAIDAHGDARTSTNTLPTPGFVSGCTSAAATARTDQDQGQLIDQIPRHELHTRLSWV